MRRQIYIRPTYITTTPLLQNTQFTYQSCAITALPTRPILTNMTDSPRGPPLLRPIPVRPFNINLKEPAPSSDESLPHTPLTGSSLNLDWLNFKLLDPRNRVRSESSTSISRAQSVMNLTSSTLMGIYEPTTYDNDKYTPGTELDTPWGAGAETPARILSVDEPTCSTQIGRAYPARRRSSTQTPPISTTASLFYSGLRALLLSGLGVLYGIGVATVRGSRPAEAFRMEHMVNASNYGWGYMAFWGASGLSLGCLLPWVDGFWENSFGDSSSGEAIETEGDATKNLRRQTDWALAVRGMGIFVGIAYAIVSSIVSFSSFFSLTNQAEESETLYIHLSYSVHMLTMTRSANYLGTRLSKFRYHLVS